MATMDTELDTLVRQMNSAQGDRAKVDATAAVVTRLVEQRKTMHERMSSGHMQMMGHMMEHMRQGGDMPDCPMMKAMTSGQPAAGRTGHDGHP